MVIRSRQNGPRQEAFVLADLAIAVAILLIAVFPLAFSINSDARLLRADYQHAVAMELVDGEMEVLAAGGWSNAPEGKSAFQIQSVAATNLPPGAFTLTRTGKQLRLEWAPTVKRGAGTIVREVEVP